MPSPKDANKPKTPKELEEIYTHLGRYARSLIEVYSGNLRRASELVGCSYGYARQLWMRDDVRAIVNQRVRESSDIKAYIADRSERQAFWTKTYHDSSLPWDVRMKASELLGKSECDFSEKKILEGSLNHQGSIEHRHIRGIEDRIKQLRDGEKETPLVTSEGAETDEIEVASLPVEPEPVDPEIDMGFLDE
jgi:hypothetical protein